jgi:cyclohexanecarboxylate-CoA ligase
MVVRSDAYTVPPLTEYFSRLVTNVPDRVALVQTDARHTYRKLASSVHACACALRSLGVEAGDVVSMQLPNWFEAIVCYLAINRIGAVVNPIIPIYREFEVGFVLRESASKVLIIPDVYRGRRYTDMLPDLAAPCLRHVVVVRDRTRSPDRLAQSVLDFDDLISRHRGEAAAVNVGSLDDALLLYTSGTESNPKGVRHSHAGLDAEARSMVADCRLSDDEAIFIASPIGHIAGVDFAVHVPIAMGAKVCLMDVWDARAATAMIRSEKCRWSSGVTAFLEGLVTAPDASGMLSEMSGYRCGGADVPPVLIEEAHRKGLYAYRTYGCTEHPTVTGRGADALKAAHTDGLPVAGTTVRIVDPDDPSSVLPNGEIGEICTIGPELFLGYRDQSLNSRAFDKDGWFRTGDLGFLDPDGYLTIAGRKKDIIIRKGENISAKQVEDFLAAHPKIKQIAVIGLPDRDRGERVCAVVVLADDTRLSLSDVSEWLIHRGLTRQKIPEQLEIVDEMPRTPTGKIRKAVLRTRFG